MSIKLETVWSQGLRSSSVSRIPGASFVRRRIVLLGVVEPPTKFFRQDHGNVCPVRFDDDYQATIIQSASKFHGSSEVKFSPADRMRSPSDSQPS
jgi:hypothetical protein